MNDNEFGIYLKSIRESKGLTQEQLGDNVTGYSIYASDYRILKDGKLESKNPAANREG